MDISKNKFILPSVKIVPSWQWCGPGMFIPDPGSEFFHPGSRVKKIPGSASAPKNLSILTQKIVTMLSEIFFFYVLLLYIIYVMQSGRFL
jgi:hypothetical protein